MKVEFRNSRGLRLVGILEEAKTDKVVIMAHGFTGDKDEWGRFTEIANALKQEGFAVLRFDFTESGESDKAGITVSGQLDDLKSAMEFTRKNGYTRIGLIGNSLGGLVSILAYDENVHAMFLMAPVTAAKTPNDFRDPKVREELEQKGYITLKKRHGEFKVDKQYLQERESVNQEEMLSRVKCSVFIIHGDQDEHVPLDHSKNAMKYLTKESKLEIVKGAKHDLKEVAHISKLAVSWFKQHL